MSEGGVGLAAVLAEHDLQWSDYPLACSCGWRSAIGGPSHAAHLTEVVLDHLAAKASEAAVVARVVTALQAGNRPSRVDRHRAAAALTAFIGALGGSVGPAGVEVAPGATDEVLGRQKGGNA